MVVVVHRLEHKVELVLDAVAAIAVAVVGESEAVGCFAVGVAAFKVDFGLDVEPFRVAGIAEAGVDFVLEAGGFVDGFADEEFSEFALCLVAGFVFVAVGAVGSVDLAFCSCESDFLAFEAHRSISCVFR